MTTIRSRHLTHFSRPEPVPIIESQVDECPQENATQNLLEISDQDLEFTSFKAPQFFAQNMNPYKHNPLKLTKKQKKQRTARPKTVGKSRLSVTSHFTECYKISKKKTILSGNNEDSHSQFKKNAINPRSYLIFSNQNYNHIKVVDKSTSTKLDNSNQKVKQKNRQTKDINHFFRKRNQSLLKHFLDFKQQMSLTQSTTMSRSTSPKAHPIRSTQSCQLSSKSSNQDEVPIKIISNMQREEEECIQLKYTNTNFRNKRLSYRGIKYAK